MLALHEEAAGVVPQVVEPSLQLSLPQQQLVVEASGKEQAVGAVLGRAPPRLLRLLSCLLRLLSCLLRLSRNILNRLDSLNGGEQPAVVAIAARLEAADDAAQVALHLLADEQDAVQVVGHHLKGEDFHLRVVAGDAQPLCLHTPAQLRQLHAGSFCRAFGSIAAPRHLAQERAAPLRHHRHHVHHALAVVVAHAAPKHRRLLLARIGFLALVDFALHAVCIVFGCKVTKK